MSTTVYLYRLAVSTRGSQLQEGDNRPGSLHEQART